ncbi:hypothetical protein, unlikely [Trypanosoma congolense IL3000]|uniref:Uncharacterized protein n=1 Tax=Trypanosoma congolense (strain IL3000) TaxID=1068625 RepID=F9WHY8_TRYCI|nr:hypothetical protein, unlikely [Trypanosoma congolense IL3000]
MYGFPMGFGCRAFRPFCEYLVQRAVPRLLRHRRGRPPHETRPLRDLHRLQTPRVGMAGRVTWMTLRKMRSLSLVEAASLGHLRVRRTHRCGLSILTPTDMVHLPIDILQHISKALLQGYLLLSQFAMVHRTNVPCILAGAASYVADVP